MSSTNRGTVRNENDFYATPESAFKPLLPHLKPLVGLSIWEPAEGDGRLVRWLNEAGFNATGTDIQTGDDFLQYLFYKPDCAIVTNPPFSLAFEFAQNAVLVSRHVVLLLRLNFLASFKRKTWFTENPPTALFVLSKRPSFTDGGTDSCDYAWFAWSPRLMGIHFL